MHPSIAVEVVLPAQMALECAFCHRGDDPQGELGSLVVPRQGDPPVHRPCALWSPNCYEDASGVLVNVAAEVRRGEQPVRATSVCRRDGCTPG